MRYKGELDGCVGIIVFIGIILFFLFLTMARQMADQPQRTTPVSEHEQMNESFITDALRTYGLENEQGLVLLQMAAKRSNTIHGFANPGTVIPIFERLIEDVEISNPKPLPISFEPLVSTTPKIKSGKQQLHVMSIPGLPIGVVPKSFKILGTQIPEHIVTDILRYMFSGVEFKSRGLCPMIESLLSANGIHDYREDMEYHIACRLVSQNKPRFIKKGTVYHYA